MGKVCIEILSEIIYSARMNSEDIKKELALLLYQQERLSFGKARELAGMSVWAFQSLLGERGIAVNYDVEDLDQDIRNLQDLARL